MSTWPSVMDRPLRMELPPWQPPRTNLRHFVESYLDPPVQLHAAIRTGRLPPTVAAARLRMLLGSDRELTTSLVLQRPELFRALLMESTPTDRC